MYCWTCDLMCNFSKNSLHSFLLIFSLLVDKPLWNLAKQPHADFSPKKSFFSPAIVWLYCDMPNLLITRIVDDKFHLLPLVNHEKLGKHGEVFKNYFVCSKDKVGKGLEPRAVGRPAQIHVFNGDYECMGVNIVLKAKFYLKHLLCSLANTWREGDKASSSLDHIVNF